MNFVTAYSLECSFATKLIDPCSNVFNGTLVWIINRSVFFEIGWIELGMLQKYL